MGNKFKDKYYKPLGLGRKGVGMAGNSHQRRIRRREVEAHINKILDGREEAGEDVREDEVELAKLNVEKIRAWKDRSNKTRSKLKK